MPIAAHGPHHTRARPGQPALIAAEHDKAVAYAPKRRVRWARADIDRAAQRLASRQHDVITAAQLGDLGLSQSAIGRRLARGQLHRVHRGVFAYGRERLTIHGTWMAAVFACGTKAFLSHRSGCALWRVMPALGGDAHVTTLSTGRRNHERVVLHESKWLRSADVTKRAGIPVLSLPCVLLDIAATEPPRRVADAIEQAERERVLDFRSCDELLRRARGRRGVRTLRAALLDWTEPQDFRSDPERLLLDACLRFGLTPPVMNASVAGHVVDALWPSERVVVEFDSYSFHGNPRAFEADRQRDFDLSAAGYRPLRMTEPDLGARLAYTMRNLARILAAARSEHDEAAAHAPKRRVRR